MRIQPIQSQSRSQFSGSSSSQVGILMTVRHTSDEADETPDGVIQRSLQGASRLNGKKESVSENKTRRRKSHRFSQVNSSGTWSQQNASKASTAPIEEINIYTRPTGPEQVSPHHPTCSSLPPSWNHIHDRFIAYLATHAPLDRNGRVQKHEDEQERWKPEEIAVLLGERFPGLFEESGMIRVSTVEKRLVLLDQAGDNDYFQKKYGAYAREGWGWGI